MAVACIPRGRGHLKLNSQARDNICVYEKVKVATTVCGYLHYVLVTHVLKANILLSVSTGRAGLPRSSTDLAAPSTNTFDTAP